VAELSSGMSSLPSTCACISVCPGRRRARSYKEDVTVTLHDNINRACKGVPICVRPGRPKWDLDLPAAVERHKLRAPGRYLGRLDKLPYTSRIPTVVQALHEIVHGRRDDDQERYNRLLSPSAESP
jgi:hypothetical protein